MRNRLTLDSSSLDKGVTSIAIYEKEKTNRHNENDTTDREREK